MRKLTSLLMLVAVLALIGIGCDSERTMVTRSDNPVALQSAPMGYPTADNLVSATLYLYVHQASGYTVNAHRITADWEEMTVTWDSFNRSYDSTIEGSFLSDDTAYKTIDLTALVSAWLDGTYDNFGVLLNQENLTYPRTEAFSRDNDTLNPYLEICYMAGDQQVCEDLMAVADAYIAENYPDANTGASMDLDIGWFAATYLEKQSLIRFEMPEMPELAALGDTVWFDINQDGIQDADEPGFPDVTVNLYDCMDNFIASTTTDADGFYFFYDLMPGDYYVEFVKPEGYAFTLQDQGTDDAVDSDADPTTGMTICTTLEPGEIDPTWDAGLYRMPQEGCTLTIGFWKNHAGFGPQDNVVSQYLPITLGDGTGKSLVVTDSAMARDILVMKTYGVPSNGITKLYAQLLAAKLNMAAGAADTDISHALTSADEFLAEYDWTDWDSLSKNNQHYVNRLKSKFDRYNNGEIGPGHCD
jgi:hypothetical protein